ncbi:MAG: TetR/AcrR family transcriptional regulator [Dermatophilaceae bacterium]
MDPAAAERTLRALWRHERPATSASSRPGPRQRLDLDGVIDAAVAVADEAGIAAVSMRSLATRLGMGAMSLYTYVAGRQELLALMVDATLGRTVLHPHPDDARAALEAVVRVTYDEHLRHPWLAEAAGVRPGLGPHAIARYEWQLQAVEPLGLADVELDQAVTLLTGFAATAAARRREVADAPVSDAEWWRTVGPVLGELASAVDTPLADRVGTAAGEVYGAASDPGRELEFGLSCLVDGLLGRARPRRG